MWVGYHQVGVQGPYPTEVPRKLVLRTKWNPVGDRYHFYLSWVRVFLTFYIVGKFITVGGGHLIAHTPNFANDGQFVWGLGVFARAFLYVRDVHRGRKIKR